MGTRLALGENRIAFHEQMVKCWLMRQSTTPHNKHVKDYALTERALSERYAFSISVYENQLSSSGIGTITVIGLASSCAECTFLGLLGHRQTMVSEI